MPLFSRILGQSDIATIPYHPNSPKGLAARWVQWGASSNFDSNPIADETGKFADKEQPDDVWFLAGCFGGIVKRTCRIPANRPILIPAFNMWFTKDFSPPDLDKAHGFLSVNGEEIELDKIFTNKPFIVRGVWGNPVTGSVFQSSMRVAGLWKQIEPLPEGEHEILIRGGDGEGFYVEVNYKIYASST